VFEYVIGRFVLIGIEVIIVECYAPIFAGSLFKVES
jgi:hypothetical protein